MIDMDNEIEIVTESERLTGPNRMGKNKAIQNRQVGQAAMASKAQRMAAQISQSMTSKTSQENLQRTINSVSRKSGEQADMGMATEGIVEHTGVDKVAVWKQVGMRWIRTEVPATNWWLNIQNGASPTCPDCGDDCGNNPNDCPGRPKLKWMQCRIHGCGKRFYDPGMEEVTQSEDEFDENEILPVTAVISTAENRLEGMWREHMLAVHPAEAMQQGIAVTGVRYDDSNVRVAQDGLDTRVHAMSMA